MNAAAISESTQGILAWGSEESVCLTYRSTDVRGRVAFPSFPFRSVVLVQETSGFGVLFNVGDEHVPFSRYLQEELQ